MSSLLRLLSEPFYRSCFHDSRNTNHSLHFGCVPVVFWVCCRRALKPGHAHLFVRGSFRHCFQVVSLRSIICALLLRCWHAKMYMCACTCVCMRVLPPKIQLCGLFSTRSWSHRISSSCVPPLHTLAAGSILVASCLGCDLCTTQQFTPVTSVAMHNSTRSNIVVLAPP